MNTSLMLIQPSLLNLGTTNLKNSYGVTVSPTSSSHGPIHVVPKPGNGMLFYPNPDDAAESTSTRCGRPSSDVFDTGNVVSGETGCAISGVATTEGKYSKGSVIFGRDATEVESSGGIEPGGVSLSDISCVAHSSESPVCIKSTQLSAHSSGTSSSSVSEIESQFMLTTNVIDSKGQRPEDDKITPTSNDIYWLDLEVPEVKNGSYESANPYKNQRALRPVLGSSSSQNESTLGSLSMADPLLSFLVDSGSTSHVINDETLFETSTSCEIPVTTTNNTIFAKRKGVVKLGKLVLNDTLFIPTSPRNILSMLRMVDENPHWVFAFSKDHVTISRKGKRLYRLERMQGETFYTIKAIPNSGSTGQKAFVGQVDHEDMAKVANASFDPSSYYHMYQQKLLGIDLNESANLNGVVTDIHTVSGHCSSKMVKESLVALGYDNVPSVKSISQILASNCHHCTWINKKAHGKLKREETGETSTEFMANHTRYSTLHLDFVGPINNVHLLIVSDRVTSFVIVEFFESKVGFGAKVVEVIKRFLVLHAGKRNVLYVMGDNEFNTEVINSYLKSIGIEPTFSAPYSSFQNGLSEVQNRKITHLSRTLLLTSMIPKHLWRYAVQHAQFLHNNVLLHPTFLKTPFNLLTGLTKTGSLATIAPFGCLAYAYDHHPGESKLFRSALVGVFLGYAATQKIAWIYVSGTVIRSSSFRTFDKVFPFRDQAKQGILATLKSDNDLMNSSPFHEGINNSGNIASILEIGGGSSIPPSNGGGGSSVYYPPARTLLNFDKSDSSNKSKDDVVQSSDVMEGIETAPEVTSVTPSDRSVDVSSSTQVVASNDNSGETTGGAISSLNKNSVPKPTKVASKQITSGSSERVNKRQIATSKTKSSAVLTVPGQIIEIVDKPAITTKTASTKRKRLTKQSTVNNEPQKLIASTQLRLIEDVNTLSSAVSKSVNSSLVKTSKAMVLTGRDVTADKITKPLPPSRSSAILRRLRSSADVGPVKETVKLIEPTKPITAGMLTAAVLDNDIEGENINYTDSSQEEVYVLVSQNMVPVPRTYGDIATSPHRRFWYTAVAEEDRAMKTENVYDLVDESEARKSRSIFIRGKYVFTVKPGENVDISKLKTDLDPTTLKFKCRLVACGQHMRTGQDFLDKFAPVLGVDGLRVLISLAAQHGLVISQLDVTRAFLHGKIPTGITLFFKPPKGTSTPEGKVWRLKKALYGLKNSPLVFYQTIKLILNDMGFVSSTVDPCIFRHRKYPRLYIGLYVDDLLVMGLSQEIVDKIIETLSKQLSVKNLGAPSTYLGITIKRGGKHSITLDMSEFISKIEQDFKVKSPMKSLSTPLAAGFDPDDESCAELNEDDHAYYRRLIGTLLYCSKTIHLEISFAVSLLSRYLAKPRTNHLKAAIRLLQFVIQNKHIGLTYTNQPKLLIPHKDVRLMKEELKPIINDYPEPTAYTLTSISDSSLGNLEGRYSQSGFITYLNNNVISWASKKQKTIATSTSDAEYMGLCDAAKSIDGFKNLLTELKMPTSFSILGGDNLAALHIASMGKMKRSKHIDIKFHYVRHQVEDKKLLPCYVNTSENVADLLTKNVDKTTAQPLYGWLFQSDPRALITK